MPDQVFTMNRNQLLKLIALTIYFGLILISLLWLEILMLFVILITVFAIYVYFSNFLAFRQRHYQKNKIGNKEEHTDSQKWDEHVAKTVMRRSRGV